MREGEGVWIRFLKMGAYQVSSRLPRGSSDTSFGGIETLNNQSRRRPLNAKKCILVTSCCFALFQLCAFRSV